MEQETLIVGDYVHQNNRVLKIESIFDDRFSTTIMHKEDYFFLKDCNKWKLQNASDDEIVLCWTLHPRHFAPTFHTAKEAKEYVQYQKVIPYLSQTAEELGLLK